MRSQRYRVIGSANPLRRFDSLEVFPTASSGTRFCRVPLRPWTCSLLQSLTGPDCHRTSQQQLSWGSFPFSDISTGSPVHSGLPRPTPSDFRVSHPLAGLRLPEPSDLVSCRYRSWGSPTGPIPLAKPLFLSKPVTFVALNRTGSTSSKLEAVQTHPRLQGFTLCEDSTPFEEG